MIVALYFPTRLDVYRYLQDSYFGLQMLVQVSLLYAAILNQEQSGQYRRGVETSPEGGANKNGMSPRYSGNTSEN